MPDEQKPDGENADQSHLPYGKHPTGAVGLHYKYTGEKSQTGDDPKAADAQPKDEFAPKDQPPPDDAINDARNWFNVSKDDLKWLLEHRKNFEARNKFWVFLTGVFFTPVTLAGVLIGFVRSFNRFDRHKAIYPYMYPLKPINRVAMFLGAIAAWLVIACLYFGFFVLYFVANDHVFLISYLIICSISSALIFGVFTLWQKGIGNTIAQSRKFGSARFARPDELPTLQNKTGFYIGQGHAFDDKGHILTVAGTRGGKGTSLIIPNLLGITPIETSWVIIDPKGENCAISASYQRSIGQNVVILNPWDLLQEHIGQSHSYNPLDILNDISSPHLVDDVQMLAEMIVPVESAFKDPFWSDTARMIISGLLLHLVITQPKQDRNLTTLWKWVRLYGDDWDKLIQDMGTNNDPISGEVVQNAANEILKLSEAGEDAFGSIMSGVLIATDFLKSSALQKSLEHGFDPKTLVDGKTTVYVIIPADKLRSHSRWLRLVTTSMLRSVIRQPGKRVTFLLDEFAALGYLPEIETALSTYAGYNVTIWAILQSLVQLENLYEKNWQSFIANCTVRQFFSINDNFSAQYISEAIGHTSNVSVFKSWFGVKNAESTPRLLITPDELRRESGRNIFIFIADLPPTYIAKLPYFLMPPIKGRANKNPYF